MKRVGQANPAREQFTHQLVQGQGYNKGKERGDRSGEAIKPPLQLEEYRLQQGKAEQGIQQQAGREPKTDDPDGPVTRLQQRTQPLVILDTLLQIAVEVAEADLDQAELAGHEQRVEEQRQRNADQLEGVGLEGFGH